MRILGINALFHDLAAALVIDGQTVAAAEEERFSRRKHGKRPVPFAAWELPEKAAAWCLARAGLRPQDLDAVTYSYDPELARPAHQMGLDDPWDHLRQTYAREGRPPQRLPRRGRFPPGALLRRRGDTAGVRPRRAGLGRRVRPLGDRPAPSGAGRSTGSYGGPVAQSPADPVVAAASPRGPPRDRHGRGGRRAP
ncbi:hypothetical protein GCM10010344_09680 [Streptomyces bluensis]|nr:hypothetical protein GCM10010344_09680 [Streptomyces bluensis]